MIKGVEIVDLNVYIDERGWLVEAFRNDMISLLGYVPAMAYVSFTKHEVVRGPHEHREQSDLFAFTGPGDFELSLWDNRDLSREQMKLIVGHCNPKAVLIPPGVVHGYKALTSPGSFSINLPDRLYRGFGKLEEVDEIRHENDPNSPFKIY